MFNRKTLFNPGNGLTWGEQVVVLLPHMMTQLAQILFYIKITYVLIA